MVDMGVKVSNIHSKVRLKDVLDIFGLFGKTTGFMACGDSFILRFESSPERALAMNNFPLAYKRMKVELVEWDNYDVFGTGNTVVFDGHFDADDIRDECSMFGHVLEVIKNNGKIYVVCKTEIEAEEILGNMYGRFYNKQRIRCRRTSELDIPGK